MMNERDTQDFSLRFQDAWKTPTPDALAELLHEDVVLRQPHLPPIHGRQSATREFAKLFRWLPGLHSVVEACLENGSAAFIRHELRFSVGRHEVRLPCVDHFELSEGRARSRVVYFDQVKLILSVLRHPSLWPGFLRYRFGG